MARHRDVRAMKYSDEYDGFDDVYGHSVEDDYCVSPSAEQFMFDRNKQQNMASFFTEPDIKEDNEDEDQASAPSKELELSEVDSVKLVSCIEAIRKIIGNSVTRAELTEKIIKGDFNVEVVLDEILNTTQQIEHPAATVTEGPDSQTDSSGSSLPFTNLLAPRLQFSPKNLLFKNPFCTKTPEMKSRHGTIESSVAQPDAKPTSLSALLVNHSKKTEHLQAANKHFNTLADLTKNHLQHSGNSLGKTSNFSIPQFFSKPRDSMSGHSHSNMQFQVQKKKNTDESVETGMREMKTTRISAEMGLENENLRQHNKKDNQNEKTSHGFSIDLTTALRQSSILSMGKKENYEPLNKYGLKEIYSTTEDPLASSMTVPSSNNLQECEIDLRCLKLSELFYSNGSVSRFGKMLCKRWQPRKPYIKSAACYKLKLFEATTESPDSLILTHLQRR